MTVLVKIIKNFLVMAVMDSPLITPWGEAIDPEQVLPEYPR
jgi:hypothetical protein